MKSNVWIAGGLSIAQIAQSLPPKDPHHDDDESEEADEDDDEEDEEPAVIREPDEC
jgi:hypothetical protein